MAALSVAALTACNNDEVMEVNRGRGITFQVETKAATRATATTTNTIKDFKVWGYTDGGSALMNALKVTGGNGSWTYGDPIFWPNKGAVDFAAISPSENFGGTASVASTDKKITGFTAATDAASQVDLLYALTTGQKRADHESSSVTLNFRHALSQIVFKAKNTNKNLTVDVKGVRIAKVIDGGDFTFPTVSTSTNLQTGSAATETDGSWGTWSLGTNKAFFKAGITESKSIGSTAVDLTSDNGALMLVPQAIKGWNIEAEDDPDTRGAYFLIDCKIASGDSEDKVIIWPVESYDTNNDGYAEVAIPVADITWQQGKKYIYTFIFGEGGGYVPPTDDPDDPNPDPEPDPDPDDPQPEDPVLVPVTFTVTVDEFQNGNGDNVDIDMTEKDGTKSSEADGN